MEINAKSRDHFNDQYKIIEGYTYILEAIKIVSIPQVLFNNTSMFIQTHKK